MEIMIHLLEYEGAKKRGMFERLKYTNGSISDANAQQLIFRLMALSMENKPFRGEVPEVEGRFLDFCLHRQTDALLCLFAIDL
jgi:hypothetical protein